ncbi:MAG: TerB family tellurite resistance protein [Caulobacteraceae bacterium]
MSFWRNIRSLAATRAKEPCPTCPEGLPGDDPQFAMAVTALGAKLAKADGRADDGEYAAFSEVFQAGEGRAERDVQRLYSLARQTTRGFESYARQLKKRYSACPQLLEDVLDGLFHIAKSDGAVTQHEVDYLERVAGLFGLSPLAFRRVKATHLGASSDDPYVVLDVPADAPDEALRAAWRRALSEAHPDRALSRGLPREYVEVAEAKSAAINSAFDRAMRERRELVGAGAA